MNARIATLLVLVPLAGLALSRSAVPGEPPPVKVPKELVGVDDGDGIVVRWPEGAETVRILGIDTPETQHLEHDIPYPQPFGEEARGFLLGCVAASDEVTLLRADKKDSYGRTLGYVFVDGKNYSVLVLSARLAVESISRYGDNGFPEQAKACLEAAKAAGPVAFEEPHVYRSRMRDVSRWLKARGAYPLPPPPK
jgi:micrococcal nuclease